MCEQLHQQAYELSELKVQRTELRRLNALLEKDTTRLTGELGTSKNEVENLKRQVNLSREALRLVKQDARTSKEHAQYAKESVQKARAELEKVKQGKERKDSKYNHLLKLFDQAVEELKEKSDLADALVGERDKAKVELEAAQDELADLDDELAIAQTMAEEMKASMEYYQKRSEEFEKVAKELRAELAAKDSPLNDSNRNVTGGKKKGKSVAVKTENVSPPAAAVATRSSKRKAATSAGTKASKKARS